MATIKEKRDALCKQYEDDVIDFDQLLDAWGLAVHVEACWTCKRALVNPDTTGPCELRAEIA